MHPEIENTGQPRSMADLIRELRDETTTLFRQEVALARTELAEKSRSAARGSAGVAAGGAIAYAGFLFILAALSTLCAAGLEAAGLSPDIAAWLGPAIVGLIVALIGYIMLRSAMKKLSADNLAPKKTVQTLKEDKEWTLRKIKGTQMAH